MKRSETGCDAIMSWTDLFKSKSAKQRPDPLVRWFGKLPTYADYYSTQASDGWSVEFNDWVLKGFETFQSRLAGHGHADHRMPVCGCALRLPDSGMTVFSSVFDYGGDMRGRPFPICFYAGVPSKSWPGPKSDAVPAAVHVVSELLALKRDVTRFLNSPGRLEAAFGNRQVDLARLEDQSYGERWQTTASAIPFSEWFDNAKDGLKVKDLDQWVTLATEWGNSLAKLDDASFEPTLRFPLAMRMPLDVQIAGWIRWLELRMKLDNRQLSLVVCGDTTQEVGSLTVIARDLVPEDFLLLTPLASSLGYLDDLTRIGESEAGETGSGTEEVSVSDEGCRAPASRIAEVGANDADATWADFVGSPATVA